MLFTNFALSMLLFAPAPTFDSPTLDLVAPLEMTEAALESRLQALLDSRRATDGFPGAVIAVHRAGVTDLLISTGVQDLTPTAKSVDSNIPWDIGSCTKTFVAVTVLQLVEEGQLQLDQNMGRLLPHVNGVESITVRQLLQHTSGLADYLDSEFVQAAPKHSWTAEELIQLALDRAPMAAIGERHTYSNTNYLVLGCLVEAITGRSWIAEVRSRILEPLGMLTTGSMTEVGAPKLGAGHGEKDGRLVDFSGRWDASLGGAAGAMYSTGADLLRFAVALENDELLTPLSRALMHNCVPAETEGGMSQGYGLGLQRYSADDVSIAGHMGSSAAHSAMFGTYDRSGVTVAVLVNKEHPGAAAALAVEVLRATKKSTPQLPEVPMPTPALDAADVVPAPEAGFHGSVQLQLGAGRMKPGANQVFGGSSTIDSLTQSGRTKNRMVGGLNFDLNYTVPEHNAQYFIASSEIEAVDAAPALEIGVRRMLANGTVLTGAYAPEVAGAFNEVWENPYATGVSRKEVEMAATGFRFAVEQPLGLPISIEYQRSQQDPDSEKSGAGLGLTSEEIRSLRRAVDVQRIEIGTSIPLSEALYLMPTIGFTTADADGAANSFDGFTGGLNMLYANNGYEFSLGAEFGSSDYDKVHPVFGKRRSEDRMALSAGVGWEQPFGWRDTRIDWLIALNKADSNITFLDSELAVLGVALTYNF